MMRWLCSTPSTTFLSPTSVPTTAWLIGLGYFCHCPVVTVSQLWLNTCSDVQILMMVLLVVAVVVVRMVMGVMLRYRRTCLSCQPGVCCAGGGGEVMAASQQLLCCWFVLSLVTTGISGHTSHSTAAHNILL